jgi:hypothetical protein
MRVEQLDGSDSDLSASLSGSLASLAHQSGITGAHLLRRAVVGPDTVERQARQRADGSSDFVALIEGYNPDAVAAAVQQFPATEISVVHVDRYQLAQAANAEDAI